MLIVEVVGVVVVVVVARYYRRRAVRFGESVVGRGGGRGCGED